MNLADLFSRFFGPKAVDRVEIQAHYKVVGTTDSQGIHAVTLQKCDPQTEPGKVVRLVVLLHDEKRVTMTLAYTKLVPALGYFIAIDGVQSAFTEGGEVATKSQLVIGTINGTEDAVQIKLCVPHYRKSE